MDRHRCTKRSKPGALRLYSTAISVALAAISHGSPVRSQPEKASSLAVQPNTAARRSFEDDRFGLFITWGLFSLVGDGEWVMEQDKLGIDQYQKLPPIFNPTRFRADQWIKLAKASGAKYITITTKHHDGFCMFGSQLTSYDVVDASHYRGDPLKEIAAACHEQKIKLFFYYSLLDWHHPDYFPLGKTGKHSGREIKGTWSRYVAYYQGQVRELCSSYGEIGGFWFDGMWDKPEADWDLAGTYRLIHELQPAALIGNNHHGAPLSGEDFQVSKEDRASPGAAGSGTPALTAGLPLETCMTINRSWAFNARDTEFKSTEDIVQGLIASAGRGSNLSLGIGPRSDGTIDQLISQRLLEVGAWLKTYGESVYGTRRGPIPPQPWGVSTSKGDHAGQRIYLHVLKPSSGKPIAFDPSTPWVPFLFGKSEPLKLTRSKDVLELELPPGALAPIDTIVVLHPQSSSKGQ